MEILKGSTNGFTAKVYDPAGKEIVKLPENVTLKIESTDAAVASVTHDEANPFRFNITGHRPGACLIHVHAYGGALDVTQSLPVLVVGEVHGTADDPRLKAASLKVEAS